MAMTFHFDNTGHWEADLDVKPCDRYNNAELTITLKVFLQQVNPAGGAATGTAREWGTDAAGVSGPGHGTARQIVKWTPHTWRDWTNRYQREAQDFWTGKFWLTATHDFADLDYSDKTVKYRPNIWCRFKLDLVDAAAKAQASISVVRLASSEPFFRSDAANYDSRDLDPDASTHAGHHYLQRANIHEVGHLLGLDHASSTSPACVASGNIGSESCYCATAADCGNIMGAGEGARESNASPWISAMNSLGGGSTWTTFLRRHYPRTMDEVKHNKEVTVRPHRG
jgi:hypothetical protein